MSNLDRPTLEALRFQDPDGIGVLRHETREAIRSLEGETLVSVVRALEGVRSGDPSGWEVLRTALPSRKIFLKNPPKRLQ